ncbi:hypothetical protein [Streptomyces sp. SP18BB07]|uniref:hypothetical protein n=1 Tax=Streptomyces sp. SP18BB07 TaxID=3002522 RepID=UPI002E75B758|nr:hypothetical protein [Streptomyces sp. SP18BB07]MEE1766328.1 hypothetical protein [Streptomyces sp. SP18BB07]
MARVAFDSRLVQTAVIGSKISERPIILLGEPDGLEVHRHRHLNYTQAAQNEAGPKWREMKAR